VRVGGRVHKKEHCTNDCTGYIYMCNLITHVNMSYRPTAVSSTHYIVIVNNILGRQL